ncbi:LCP family protein [Microlunatus speluncae]|uniref:LCP family glycopolymer transferase n=1 Tax=Microlunatus speluncae TaxID=2594267 RepID=UPI0012668408|nr:LCP family protein [Microlunatus speluncae]
MADEQDQWHWDLPETSARQARARQRAREARSGRNGSGSSRSSRRTVDTPGFRRTVLFTILGAVVPGAGLLAAGRKKAGAIVLTVFVLGLVTLGLWAVVDPKGLASIAVTPELLNLVSVIAVIIGLAWVVVVIASHLALRNKPSSPQRIAGGLLVGLLAFAVAAPMAVAARYSYDQADLVAKVFQRQDNSKSATRPTMNPHGNQNDPWKGKDRLNVLLLGGDGNSKRPGIRTDTVIVASIDTKTGNTTLISLPRCTARMPFPEDSPLHQYYPDGFTNGNGDDLEFCLTAMYENVPANVPKDVLGETDNLNADVVKISAGEALGLKIDYYVLVNLKGFEQLIDALGGLTLNVNFYIPKGGDSDAHIPPSEFLTPGPSQHLNGKDSLWYARGRYGYSDFSRMDRQRCVIDAIIKQANPANLLARYEAIAKAGKEIVQTDIPQEMLPAMVELATRVQGGNIRSVVFTHGEDGFLVYRPDFDMMRERVRKAIGESEKKPKKQTQSPAPGDPQTSEPADPPPSSEQPKDPETKESDPPESDKNTKEPDDKKDEASDDTGDSCKFRPDIAATSRPKYTG